jgi:hypothetical protein
MEEKILSAEFTGVGAFSEEDSFEEKMSSDGDTGIDLKIFTSENDYHNANSEALSVFSTLILLHMRGREKRS